MAHEVIRNRVNATYTGSNLVATDENAGLAVKVVGGSQSGAPIPEIEKTSVATDVISGILELVNVPQWDTRAPTGIKSCSYVNSGIIKVKKMGAPANDDIGGQIMPTTTAGQVSVDSTAPNVGFGEVVDITGTTTSDYLYVDLDRAAQNRA